MLFHSKKVKNKLEQRTKQTDSKITHEHMKSKFQIEHFYLSNFTGISITILID